MALPEIDRSACGFDVCPMPRLCKTRRACGHGTIVTSSPKAAAERQADAMILLLRTDPALGRAALVRFFEAAGQDTRPAAVRPIAAAPNCPPPPKPKR